MSGHPKDRPDGPDESNAPDEPGESAGLPELTGMRVAVTGASGFCGGQVAVTAQAAGADVVCVGRRPGPLGHHLPWDAARAVPELGAADVVVHCAAAVGDSVGGAAEAAMRAVNVDGTARLLDAVGERPLVWISSGSVYDPRTDRRTVREDHPVAGQLNAYGRTKAAGERLALAAGAVVLRPRAVYGPGDPHLVPRLLDRVRAGTLLLPGPDVALSLTAVENLADAALAATGWPPGAYNIADSRPYGRDDTVRAVLRAHGVRARLVHLPHPVAVAAARAAEAYARRGARAPAPGAVRGGPRGVRGAPAGEPVLSRYAVDQLAHSVVLDVSKARGQGWTPRRTLADYLAALGHTPPPVLPPAPRPAPPRAAPRRGAEPRHGAPAAPGPPEAPGSSGAPGALRGSVRVTRSPCGSFGAKPTVPPPARSNARVIDSPSPDPDTF